ncbi:MAG: peptide-methionine (S)-S-oxide reductase [Planctomycetota bacterium]|nr:MAG: peptide-methionine (S)-S-oxide reductase [Planctomycetota bacterium]
MGPSVATFAAGDFWKVEEVFRRLPGALATRVGFMGGSGPRPDRARVRAGGTGHAEVCEVVWDPERIGYEDLLAAFWACHDPTESRPAAGPGGPERSILFVHDESHREIAERSLAAVRRQAAARVGTEILPAATFWPAALEHQRRLARHRSPLAEPVGRGGACPERSRVR